MCFIHIECICLIWCLSIRWILVECIHLYMLRPSVRNKRRVHSYEGTSNGIELQATTNPSNFVHLFDTHTSSVFISKFGVFPLNKHFSSVFISIFLRPSIRPINTGAFLRGIVERSLASGRPQPPNPNPSICVPNRVHPQPSTRTP